MESPKIHLDHVVCDLVHHGELSIFRRLCRDDHRRWFSRLVTLVVRLYRFRTKRADLRCTFSILVICPSLYGSQTVHAYSKTGRTSAVVGVCDSAVVTPSLLSILAISEEILIDFGTLTAMMASPQDAVSSTMASSQDADNDAVGYANDNGNGGTENIGGSRTNTSAEGIPMTDL